MSLSSSSPAHAVPQTQPQPMHAHDRHASVSTTTATTASSNMATSPSAASVATSANANNATTTSTLPPPPLHTGTAPSTARMHAMPTPGHHSSNSMAAMPPPSLKDLRTDSNLSFGFVLNKESALDEARIQRLIEDELLVRPSLTHSPTLTAANNNPTSAALYDGAVDAHGRAPSLVLGAPAGGTGGVTSLDSPSGTAAGTGTTAATADAFTGDALTASSSRPSTASATAWAHTRELSMPRPYAPSTDELFDSGTAVTGGIGTSASASAFPTPPLSFPLASSSAAASVVQGAPGRSVISPRTMRPGMSRATTLARSLGAVSPKTARGAGSTVIGVAQAGSSAAAVSGSLVDVALSRSPRSPVVVDAGAATSAEGGVAGSSSDGVVGTTGAAVLPAPSAAAIGSMAPSFVSSTAAAPSTAASSALSLSASASASSVAPDQRASRDASGDKASTVATAAAAASDDPNAPVAATTATSAIDKLAAGASVLPPTSGAAAASALAATPAVLQPSDIAAPDVFAATAPTFELNSILSLIQGGMTVIVQDDFSKCFMSSRSPPWNWNAYLYPLWICGVFVRYCILFPIRFLCLLLGFGIFFVSLMVLKATVSKEHRPSYELALIRFLCSAFVFSWTGVIRYHGTIPQHKANRIYVSNHTSLIDMIILSQMNSFSLVGQKQGGFVGLMQNHVLSSLRNCWFDRAEATDRQRAAQRIKAHIADVANNRLLIFPEGVCVNNEYCMQFKQGAFDMDAEICPIAIKYNKIFVEAFWNSRAQSFPMHLLTLMTSWAVVCDVWYLGVMRQRPGENAIDFSNRVKARISDRAGLKNVNWDGYLKHFRPSARYIQEQQHQAAERLTRTLESLLPDEYWKRRAQVIEEARFAAAIGRARSQQRQQQQQQPKEDVAALTGGDGVESGAGDVVKPAPAAAGVVAQ